MTTETNVLIHHGIKGQKWGVRRYQNEDGSRTSAGLAHDRKLYAEENDNDSGGPSERRGLTESQKEALKTVGKVALAAAAVGATAYLYTQHKDEIDSAVRQMSAQLTNKLPTQTMNSGRSFVSGAFEDARASIQLKANARQHREDAAKAIKDKASTAVAIASEAAGKAGNAVKNTAKSAADKVGESAKNASQKVAESASSAGKSIKTASSNAAKSAGEGIKKAAKSAEDKATAYLVTRTVEKAADRRLQKQQEKNRHKEEMARIKRGK